MYYCVVRIVLVCLFIAMYASSSSQLWHLHALWNYTLVFPEINNHVKNVATRSPEYAQWLHNYENFFSYTKYGCISKWTAVLDNGIF